MNTRKRREETISKKGANSILGLKKEPCLSGILDEFERADSEGLTQLVEQTIAEINRSGTLGGYGLELAIANIAMDVPSPRTVRCEQKEGMSIGPGDVWLDKEGVRYEFQCKHSLNWTVELPVRKAQDRIAAITGNDNPGFLYELTPTTSGDEKSWLAFADWVVSNYRNWMIGEIHTFDVLGHNIGTFSLMQAKLSPGLSAGITNSPGGAQILEIELLKKKLKAAFSESKHTISALPAWSQMNCLVVEFENWLLSPTEIFQAVYGRIEYHWDGKCFTSVPVWDGLFYTLDLDLWSAVLFTKWKTCSPFAAETVLFPHPEKQAEVSNAFLSFPRTRIVRSTGDVDL